MTYDINIIHLFQAPKPTRFSTTFTEINENRVKAEHSIYDLITFLSPNSSSTPISTFPLVTSSDFYENCYVVAAYKHWPAKPHTAQAPISYDHAHVCVL